MNFYAVRCAECLDEGIELRDAKFFLTLDNAIVCAATSASQFTNEMNEYAEEAELSNRFDWTNVGCDALFIDHLMGKPLGHYATRQVRGGGRPYSGVVRLWWIEELKISDSPLHALAGAAK